MHLSHRIATNFRDRLAQFGSTACVKGYKYTPKQIMPAQTLEYTIFIMGLCVLSATLRTLPDWERAITRANLPSGLFICITSTIFHIFDLPVRSNDARVVSPTQRLEFIAITSWISWWEPIKVDKHTNSRGSGLKQLVGNSFVAYPSHGCSILLET